MNHAFFKSSQALLSVVVVIAAAVWMAIGVPQPQEDLSPRFDWPDETANYFWINQYATTGSLVFAEPLNDTAQNQIHPRSFNVRSDGALVPGSFIGMILLFGFVTKLVGGWVIPFITPMLAVGGIWAWYGIVWRLFGERLAIISALLLVFHPAWWYYASSPLLPNISFVSLVLISLWLILESRGTVWKWAFAGLAIGAAVAIRPADALWIAGLEAAALAYALTQYKNRRVIGLIVFILIGAAMLVPTFLQQQAIYGGALVSGYTQLQNTTTCTSCAVVKGLVAPFGIHPGHAAYTMAIYLFVRLWWWAIPILLGLVLIVTQPVRSMWYSYLLVVGVLTAWLGLYYGSWEFSDQLTVNLNTLGLSYVRYWLPIYIALTPLVALAISWLTHWLQGSPRKIALVAFLFLLYIPSAHLVLYAKPDSLIPVRERIGQYYEIARQINEVTESNAVIVAVRKDKVFFPERRVIHTFEPLSENQELQPIVSALLPEVPVYYYAVIPESAVVLSSDLHLEPIQSFGNEVLYRVYKPAIVN